MDIFYTQQISTWLQSHLLVSYDAVEYVIVPTNLEEIKHKQPITNANLQAERLVGR